jgi:hypothetical protein
MANTVTLPPTDAAAGRAPGLHTLFLPSTSRKPARPDCAGSATASRG